MTEKLCKDCKYSRANVAAKFANCHHPNNLTISPVTGESEFRRWGYCSVQRLEGRFGSWMLGTCGKAARWFEPLEGK